MKISNLTFLKPNKKAQIISIIPNATLSNHAIEKLYSVGISPGENVLIQNRVKDLYVIKTDMNNPFCVRENVVKSIIIKTDRDSLYTSHIIRKKEESFLNTIKNFLNNVFKK